MATEPVKLPSGNWRSVAIIGHRPDGKPIRKSFTAPTKHQAKKLANAAEVRKKDDVVFAEESQLPLGDAIDRFIELKTPVLSPSTILSYRAMRRTGLQGIMLLRLCDLTPAIIQQEISREAQTKSAKTVRNIHGLLSAVLKLYRPELQLQTRLPQKQKQEILIPSLSEIQSLIDAADAKGDHDLALAIMLGAQLGLRRSEMCALTFADLRDGSVIINKALVVDKDKVWRLKPPKSAAGYRTLPLTAPLQQRFTERSGAPDERILTISPDIITRRFERLRDKLGITRFRFHDLRHYNASVMISLNIPTMYITRRLGHNSDAMVKQVYGHLIQDKQAEINDQMNAYFK